MALAMVFMTTAETIAQYGAFRFVVFTPRVWENDHEANIEIRRYNADYAQQVLFSAYASSSARNFVPTNRVLTFLPGVTSLHTKVQLVDDNIVSATSDYAYLKLIVDGSQADSTTLVILEDEQGIQIPGSSTYCTRTQGNSRCLQSLVVRETDGEVRIPLNRTGRPSEPLAISYVTEDVTGVIGKDFLKPSGVVTFQPGELTNFIAVPLVDNTLRDAARVFNVIFTAATPQCEFGIAGARVTIGDDDIMGAPGSFAPFNFSKNICSTTVNQLETQADGSMLVGTDCYDVGYLIRIGADGISLPFRNLAAWPNPFWRDPAGAIYFSESTSAAGTYQLRKLLPYAGEDDPAWSVRHDGSISAFVAWPNGQKLIGGTFKTVNGTLSQGWAMLRPDGTVDSSFRSASLKSTTMGAVAEADGSFWGFGVSATIEGTTTTGGFHFLPNGAVDLSSGYLGYAHGAAHRLRDGRMVSSYFGMDAWMADGSVDPVFTDAGGNFLTELPDGRFLATGGMLLTRRYQDGSLDSSFITDIDNEVRAAEPMGDGRVLVGGRFLTVNGIPARFLAKLHLYEEAAPTALLWNGFRIAALEGTNCLCTILRDGNSAEAVTVSYQTVPGPAIAGVDFVATSGEVTFAPGERWRAISIPILRNPDGFVSNKTFEIRLSCTNTALLGVSTNLAVTIVDRDLEIDFADSELRVSEAARNVSVAIRKNSGPAYSAVLRWEFVSTDSQPLPFATNRGVLFMPPGAQVASIKIQPIDDSLAQGPRTCVLRLTALSSNVALVRHEIPLTVLDNDLPGYAGDVVNGRIDGFEELTNGVVLAWGPFEGMHGESRKGIAALDPQTGRLARDFVLPGDWGAVHAVSASPDGGWIAAVSRVISNTNAYAVERFSSDGRRIQPVYDPLPAAPSDIALSPDGALYAWNSSPTYNGSFIQSYYTSRGRGIMAKYDRSGKRDTNFVTKLTASAEAFFEPTGEFWLGGGFVLLNEAPFAYSSSLSIPAVRSYFAKFTPQGTLITNSAAIFNNAIRSIVRCGDGAFYALGTFTTVNDRPVPPLVRLTRTGELDPSFAPKVSSWQEVLIGQMSGSLVPLQDGAVLTCLSSGYSAELTIYETNGAIRQAFGTRELQLSRYVAMMFPNSIPILSAAGNSALFIGGDVISVGGKNRDGLCRWWMDGVVGTDAPFDLLGVSRSSGEINLDLEIRVEGQYTLEESSDLVNWQQNSVLLPSKLGRRAVHLRQTSAGSTFFRLSRTSPF